MSDDDIDPNDPGVIELAKRLEAYADARLSPSGGATTRIRANVMTVAHRRAALIAADGSGDGTGASTSAIAAARASSATSAWRRPAAAILAGVLTLALLVGTAFASKPGGMLYGARLWTEMANLPADVVARAQAEIDRLDSRLNEAQQASSAGDASAAEAALVAYSVIVLEAGKGSGGDPTASAALEISVTRHVVVLTLMVDSVPAPARPAVERALSSTAMVLDDLDGSGATSSPHGATDANLSKATKPSTRKGSGRSSPGEPAVVAPAAPAANDAVDATDATTRKPEKPGKRVGHDRDRREPGEDGRHKNKGGTDGPGPGKHDDKRGDCPPSDGPGDPGDALGDPNDPSSDSAAPVDTGET